MQIQRLGGWNDNIEEILRELKGRRHYTFPGRFGQSAKRLQRVARQQKWINKAKRVGSAIDGGSYREEKTKCLATASV